MPPEGLAWEAALWCEKRDESEQTRKSYNWSIAGRAWCEVSLESSGQEVGGGVTVGFGVSS